MIILSLFYEVGKAVNSGGAYNNPMCLTEFNTEYRSKLDRWPCHVAVTEKKALLDNYNWDLDHKVDLKGMSRI